MSDKRFIVAFEIGSSKIKGAVASVNSAGDINVIAVEEESLVDSVRYGMIRKVQDVSDRIQAITNRLEMNPSLAPSRICGAYVSLGGMSLMSTKRSVERSYNEETEITSDIIKQIKEQARAAGVDDRDVVAVLTNGFVVDTLPQKNPEGIFGHDIKADLTLLHCRLSVKGNLNRVFSERLPVAINGYIIRPLAEANLVLTDDERHLGCMLVDFGAETTTVSIYKNDALQYLATIPMGSRNITRDLTALNCTERRAEEMKKVIGDVDPRQNFEPRSTDGVDNTEINNYILGRVGEIIANIMEQPVYANYKPEELPAGIIVVGGGSNLKGFISLFADHSGMKVRRGVPLGPVTFPDSKVKTADAVDIVSLLSIASKLQPKICIEFPETVSNGTTGTADVAPIPLKEETDPHVITPKHPRSSLLERLKASMLNIINEGGDSYTQEND